MIDGQTVLFSCNDCRGTQFVDCYRTGDTICTNCGLVRGHLVGEKSDYRHLVNCVALDSTKKRCSAPYSRVYHFNELMAQWRDDEPRISETHPGFLEKVLQYAISCKGGPGANIFEWDHDFIKRLCKSLGEPKLGERWVQIKNYVYNHCYGLTMDDDSDGIYWEFEPDPKPSDRLINNLRANWTLLSHAFDHTLYRPGKRRTSKDNVFFSSHELARHNFLHSGAVIQQMLKWEGELEQVKGQFYFPNIKTAAVKRKTRRMFDVLLKFRGWCYDHGPYCPNGQCQQD